MPFESDFNYTDVLIVYTYKHTLSLKNNDHFDRNGIYKIKNEFETKHVL